MMMLDPALGDPRRSAHEDVIDGSTASGFTIPWMEGVAVLTRMME